MFTQKAIFKNYFLTKQVHEYIYFENIKICISFDLHVQKKGFYYGWVWSSSSIISSNFKIVISQNSGIFNFSLAIFSET